MQFQSHYNRFLLSLEGTKNKYVSFCKNIISFCAPRTFRFADYIDELCTSLSHLYEENEYGLGILHTNIYHWQKKSTRYSKEKIAEMLRNK